jgi:hypothetical protein
MWWNTEKYAYIWKSFKQQNLSHMLLKYHGDQDYITDMISGHDRRFFELNQIKSWRWQCLDGGYDFSKRRHLQPHTGAVIKPTTSIIIFHGNPKPSQVQDPAILDHWR